MKNMSFIVWCPKFCLLSNQMLQSLCTFHPWQLYVPHLPISSAVSFDCFVLSLFNMVQCSWRKSRLQRRSVETCGLTWWWSSIYSQWVTWHDSWSSIHSLWSYYLMVSPVFTISGSHGLVISKVFSLGPHDLMSVQYLQ